MTSVQIAALDTNVLLLKLVVDTDVSLLRSFKRVELFDEGDIKVLANLLAPFDAVISTPHVLSETSNFVGQAPSYRRAALAKSLQEFVTDNEEWYEQARSLARNDFFTQLGLADTGLVSASYRATVITMDWRLAGQIEKAGGRVINFNHRREIEI